MKIKICGLARPEDVKLAVELGAYACGFVLAPSPRQVDWELLRQLVAFVPDSVLSVGVMVNPSRDEVEQALSIVDRVQLHGNESPEFCRSYASKAWKAFRIRRPEDLDMLSSYSGVVEAFVLDSYTEGVAGGTGRTFPWTYLQGRKFEATTFLAGGLGPDNVADACSVSSVHGLDVSSGVEAAPGEKDLKKMRDFFAGAKAAAGF